MTPERWAQVKDVLYAVLDLSPDQRPAYLDRICAADLPLREQVESFILSHAQIDSDFLKTIVVKNADTANLGTRHLLVGRLVGQYRIVEEIGAGGMGEVYRAVRADDQFQKEVAIKVVSRGFDTDAGLRRFKAERQILASLDHPHIAGLLDSGTSDDGVPYVVMELVEGKPIDQFCDVHKLGLTERLSLFRQVCAAVHYAHQHLIVHRDLKPGNILVTRDGVPKLLDFGIAKLLAPEMVPLSLEQTATMMRVMTPEFASPEQVRGEAITTASDIYSLGVVLYRMLTGLSPYRITSAPPHEIARQICEAEPKRPSLAIAGADGMPGKTNSWPATAQERRRLRRGLVGDVDNLVLMALRKEPQRRYASVAQFSEDIRRHLEGLPIVARKDTFSYRAGKFVIRHKVGVAAAVVIATMLFAGITLLVRETRIAEGERVRAEKRLEDVRQFSDALIFDVHDAVQKLPGATPVRKLLLDRAVQYLDSVSTDANGNASLQRELAWAYQRLATVQGDTTQANLGEISAAESSSRKALALFEAAAKSNPHNLTDQLNLAMAYRTRAFFDIYEVGGRQEIDQALRVTDPLMLSDGAKLEVKYERSLELYILAEILDATGNRLQAVEPFRQHRDLLFEIARTNPEYPEIGRRLAKADVRLGYHLARVGSTDEGMQLLNQGIATYESLVKLDGSSDLQRELSASSKGRRGIIEIMIGDIAAARADFRSARETIARLAVQDPKNVTLQSDHTNLDFEDARALAVDGKYAEALPALQREYSQYLALNSEADSGPGPGGRLAWIGEVHAATHNMPEALKSFEKAAAVLAKDQTTYDDARCDLAMVQTKIGFVLLKLKKLPEARAVFGKALETANLSFSIEHMDIPSLYAAADAYAGMGEVAAAAAKQTKDLAERSTYEAEARSSYEKSVNVRKLIPNALRINGNEYLVGDYQHGTLHEDQVAPVKHGLEILDKSKLNKREVMAKRNR